MSYNLNIVPLKPNYSIKKIIRRVKAYWFSIATFLSSFCSIIFALQIYLTCDLSLNSFSFWMLAIFLFSTILNAAITFFFLMTEKKSKVLIKTPNCDHHVIH